LDELKVIAALRPFLQERIDFTQFVYNVYPAMEGIS